LMTGLIIKNNFIIPFTNFKLKYICIEYNNKSTIMWRSVDCNIIVNGCYISNENKNFYINNIETLNTNLIIKNSTIKGLNIVWNSLDPKNNINIYHNYISHSNIELYNSTLKIYLNNIFNCKFKYYQCNGFIYSNT